MYQLGLSYGWEVGNQSKSLTKDAAAAVKLLEYYGLMAGWGRFEAPDLEKSVREQELLPPKNVIVKVFNNFFARAAKSETGNPSCFFFFRHNRRRNGRIVWWPS
nr:hypothetical protein [uncultured Nitrososphaera sp.]